MSPHEVVQREVLPAVCARVAAGVRPGRHREAVQLAARQAPEVVEAARRAIVDALESVAKDGRWGADPNAAWDLQQRLERAAVSLGGGK